MGLVAVVALGGALGAVARYAVSRWLVAESGAFPWGTFVVNVTGSFLIGLLLVVLAARLAGSRFTRPLLVTGVLGGYTTFSTYMVDALLAVRAHRAGVVVIYLFVSVCCGLVATIVGIGVGRAAFGRHR